ncbi:MAG TPA: NUDIX domain-containing protein [Candidatus Dormibacteraeota bacterium]|nr:NUDIX domain-containing protein [Candidatus Dormibacteraeota bacterium]
MEEHGRLKLVADVALFSGDRVLLVKYKDTYKYDQQAGWFLPDDYLRRLEHPEDAALRILKDQVGLDTVRIDLRLIESFEGNKAWHLVFHFAATLRDGSAPTAGTNTAAMGWFSVDHLPDRADIAHEGWALDVLASLAKPPEASAHIRSVVS